MQPSLVAAVLLAAVLHAVWNALAHSIADKLVGFALIGVALTLLAAPVVALAPLPAAASWPFLTGSAIVHVAYNLLLMRSYRLGEFGQVYPLARGTSYTTLDGLGVRSADTVAGYTGWPFWLQGPVLPLVALAVRRGRLWPQLRPHLRAGLAGGVLITV